MKDRKNEYIKGDNIICQDDCDFAYYDIKYKRAKCECYAKESSSSFADMTINKNKIFENLKDIRNLMNLKILICYKKPFSFNSIFHNLGSLIIICVIFFHIISIFIFYINQLKKIKKWIKDIIIRILYISPKKLLEIKKNKIKATKRKQRRKRSDKIKKNILPKNNKDNYKNIKQKNLKLKNNIIANNNSIDNNFKITTNIMMDYNINNNRNFLKSNNNKDKKIKKLKKSIQYNFEEMNDLPYNLALKYDKRKFCQYYISLLKVKHNFIYSFYNYDDYNSRIIKIDLFFIGFIMDYAINALFFNDETMHEIYVDKGLFDLETQLSIALYSFLISYILSFSLGLFGLSNDSIISFKQNLNKDDIKNRRRKLLSCLKLKYILYFLISYIFLLFFLVLYFYVRSNI